MSSRRALLALFLCLAGCGASSAPSGGPAGDQGTSSGGFAIRVNRAGLTSSVGAIAAGSGNVFVVIDVTLSNESVSPALVQSPLFFTVTTKAALVIRSSAASAVTVNPCRAEVGIASGATSTCAVAFEVAKTDAAVTLGYDDAQGHTATAPIPPARVLAPPGSIQPPPRPTTSGTGGATQWFVVNTMRLGLKNAAGTAQPDAWQSYGYDLDYRITTAEDSKTSNGSCKRRAGSATTTLADGKGGVDNSFGKHFMQVMRSLKSDVEESANDSIRAGKGTLLLRLDNVGGPDNAAVPGALFSTGSSTPPRFDGSDVLPVLTSSVDGSLDRPIATFAGGYMAGGAWVSGDLPGNAFDVPLLVGGIPFVLHLDGILSVRVDDGENGMIAGVSGIDAFRTALTPWARNLGICPGNATFDQLVDTVTKSADLVSGAPSFQDTERECDALSAGLGFTMVRAQAPTTIVPATVLADPCK